MLCASRQASPAWRVLRVRQGCRHSFHPRHRRIRALSNWSLSHIHVPVRERFRLVLGRFAADPHGRRLRLRGRRRRRCRPRRAAERRRWRDDPVEATADVHLEREHDADRLLGAQSRRRAPQQPCRLQLRHRLQGQPRLPGPLERLPGHRLLRSGEPDPDRTTTRRARTPPARATSSSTATSSSARGTRPRRRRTARPAAASSSATASRASTSSTSPTRRTRS